MCVCLFACVCVCVCVCRFSGPTVHFVNEEFDRGPILAQRVVPVYPTDTPAALAARVLKEVRVHTHTRGHTPVLVH